MNKNKSRGQMLLEALWLVLFAFSFLTAISYLYEKGNQEIKFSRNTNI